MEVELNTEELLPYPPTPKGDPLGLPAAPPAPTVTV
jgi:hypothetical protein